MTAFTIDEKLSSVSMMSEASLATSVPAIPYKSSTVTIFFSKVYAFLEARKLIKTDLWSIR